MPSPQLLAFTDFRAFADIMLKRNVDLQEAELRRLVGGAGTGAVSSSAQGPAQPGGYVMDPVAGAGTPSQFQPQDYRQSWAGSNNSAGFDVRGRAARPSPHSRAIRQCDLTLPPRERTGR